MKNEFTVGEKYDMVYTPSLKAQENGFNKEDYRGLEYHGRFWENEDVNLYVFKATAFNGIFIDPAFIDQWEITPAESEPKEDYLETRDFVDLMQCYRIASEMDQANVIKRFEAVKTFIREGSDARYSLESHIANVKLLEDFDFNNYLRLGSNTQVKLDKCIEIMNQVLITSQEAIKKATL